MPGKTEKALLDSLASSGKRARPSPEALVGSVISHRYRIDEIIGQGGMGVVFNAWDLQLARRVAIKALQPMYAGIPEIAQRFAHEAQACAQISHPGVVRVHNVEEAELLGSVQAIMVMEYVEARPLSELIRERGGFSDDEALDLVRQILEAVAAFHAAGVIHRDLKPANILVRLEDGRMRTVIVDFGLAKSITGAIASARDLTLHGNFLGTPTYAAPEQVLDASSVTAAVDIYACAIILFELLAGKPPFQGSPSQILRAHVTQPLPAIGMKLAGRRVPNGVEKILARAAAKRPEDRFHDALAMRNALRTAFSMPQPAPVRRKRSAWPGRVLVPVVLIGAILLGTVMFLRARARSDSALPAPAQIAAPARGTDPSAESPTTERGCALGANGYSYREAVAMLNLVVEAHPEDAEAWYCLGRAASFTADGESVARNAFESFLKLKPKDRDKRSLAGDWLRQHKRR